MHHVLDPLVLVLVGVIRLVVPRAQADEAGRDHAAVGAVRQLIARKLLRDKPIVRQIVIEGVDDPIAVPPRAGLFLVAFVATGVGIADDIEPIPRPVLAVERRCEQSIDESRVGIRGGIVRELVDLLSRRRQADDVKVDAANKRSPIGRRRRLPTAGVQPLCNEGVDRRETHGLQPVGFRHAWTPHRLKRPPISAAAGVGRSLIGIKHATRWPDCPAFNPSAKHCNLGVRQSLRFLLLGRRHLPRFEPLDQMAFRWLAGNDRRSGFAPFFK